jgi:hypothetical protein
MQWRARAYPERVKQVVLPLQPLVLLAPRKESWAGAIVKYLFFQHAHYSSLQFAKRQRRDTTAAGEDEPGRCAAEKRSYNRLYARRGKLILAAK